MLPARLSAAVLTALVSVSSTQALAAEEPTTVPPVVVSATRSAQSEVTTPASITVITREEILASGATQVAEVLRGQGAVQLYDFYGDGSRATVGLRGFGVTGVSNTLVLVDGRRLNNTDIAGPDLASIALGDVERIEIVQGSAGALYGDQAVGGVINIITRGITERRVEVEGTLGEDSTQGLRVYASDRFANGVGVKATVEGRETDNYRDHNELQSVHASLLGDIEHDGERLFAELRYSDEELELAGELTPIQIAQDRRQAKNQTDFNDSQTWVTRLGGSQRLGDAWQIEAELGYRDAEVEALLEFFGDPNTLLQDREHWTFTPRLVGTLPVGNDEALVTLGIDYDDIDYNLDSRGSFSTFLQDADQQMWAVYGQTVIPLGARWTATVGARYAEVDNALDEFSEFFGSVTTQDIDVEDDATAFEAGLAFQASPEWRVFARIDTPFRFAKVDENAYRPQGSAPLDTQTGESWEGGVEWSRDGASLKALAYRLDLEDELGYDPSSLDPFGFFSGANVNFDDTRRDGLTIEGALPITRDLLLRGQLSFVDASFREGPYQGNDVPMVAERTARLALDYAFAPAWALFGEAVYLGERHLDGDFDNVRPRLDSVTLVNANLRYLRGPWTAELRVTNLTDREYSDYGAVSFAGDIFYPAPEQRWFLTVGYQFN
ncbi:MAG: TonB-dependent receptor [Gammaproteobacteria bacterium]|nr:TonB-dependent receptor [Gammaproteobacteria bacterium]